MIKYSIITCLFGNYDALKEPEEIDNNAEYICITNRTDLQSNVWKFIYDKELDNYELGIQKSFVVKYKKLFTYINPESKYIIRLDASIQIHKALYDIVKYIDDNNYDCCLMLHPERNDMINEYNEWESLRNHNKEYKDIFIREMSKLKFDINYTGLIETTFQIYKVNQHTKNLVKSISDIIERTTNFCDNNDQCYYTYILSNYIKSIKPLFVNRQIISSDYMDLCFHYGNEIVYKDHNHARGPLGEFIYDLDTPIKYNILGKETIIKFF